MQLMLLKVVVNAADVTKPFVRFYMKFGKAGFTNFCAVSVRLQSDPLPEILPAFYILVKFDDATFLNVMPLSVCDFRENLS
jgi:hypothetical protein